MLYSNTDIMPAFTYMVLYMAYLRCKLVKLGIGKNCIHQYNIFLYIIYKKRP